VGHSAALQVNLTDPQIKDTATGAELGITQLVSSYTSYFRGSSDERVHNIQTAAARFHGLLIAPGATLSMSDVIGNITWITDTPSPIIVGDQTIEGVGRRFCQVSTTLFRTAFFGGYRIDERHAHAYRVGYYEQTASGHNAQFAGLDATVFVPIVDFKFTNDTPYWLLMETYVSPTYDTLTWKFYSTSDGRSVDWETTGPPMWVEPPIPFIERTHDLPKGKIKQVEYAADGATVSITRTVTRNGQILYNDTFNTKYEPWQAVI
jgi:vancomycin resistance protein YoaR